MFATPVNVDYCDDRIFKGTPEYRLFMQASVRNIFPFSLCELSPVSFCFTLLSPYFKEHIRTQVSMSQELSSVDLQNFYEPYIRH